MPRTYAAEARAEYTVSTEGRAETKNDPHEPPVKNSKQKEINSHGSSGATPFPGGKYPGGEAAGGRPDFPARRGGVMEGSVWVPGERRARIASMALD